MKQKLIVIAVALGAAVLAFAVAELLDAGASAAERTPGCSAVSGGGPALGAYVSTQLTAGQLGPQLQIWNTGDRDCLVRAKVRLRLEHRRSNRRYRVRGNPSLRRVHRIVPAHGELLLTWQWSNYCRAGQRPGSAARGRVVYRWRVGSKVIELLGHGTLPRCLDPSRASQLSFTGAGVS